MYQTKAFCKFLPVIVVLYLGFLTTFTMLARDRMSLNDMSWLLIKVFFGYGTNHHTMESADSLLQVKLSWLRHGREGMSIWTPANRASWLD